MMKKKLVYFPEKKRKIKTDFFLHPFAVCTLGFNLSLSKIYKLAA